ncbi:MAG: Ig-like domain-containing protein [Armatimonadota bacterium]
MNLLTPKEVRFGGLRKLVSFGDGSTENTAIYGELVTGLASVDATRAGRLMGAWNSVGKPHRSNWGSTLFRTDENAATLDPALGNADFPGYLSILRNAWDTNNETAVHFINGDDYRDHRHDDWGTLSMYALGAPLSIDWGCQYAPRVPGSYQHSVVTPVSFLSGAAWDADNSSLSAGYNTWKSGPAVAGDPNKPNAFESFTNSGHAKAYFSNRVTPTPTLEWTRDMYSIHPNENFPVIMIRDTFSGTDAAVDKVFTLNLMATGNVTTPGGTVTPTTRMHPQLPSTATPFTLSAGVNRLGFTGQWSIDWDLYTVSTTTQQALVGNWGHAWHPALEMNQFVAANGRAFDEKQHILRIKSGGAFKALILPYRKGEGRSLTVTENSGVVTITAGNETTNIADGYYTFQDPAKTVLSTFDANAASGYGFSAQGGPVEIVYTASNRVATITAHGAAGARTITVPSGSWEVTSGPLTYVSGSTWTMPYSGGAPVVATLTRSFAKTGLQLWLKADAGITKDVDGYVSNWADQSGLGHHAAQATQAVQPLFMNSALNNMPALSFDSDFMAVNGSFQVAQVYTVFKSPTTTFSNNGAVLGVPAGTGNRTYMFVNGSTSFYAIQPPVAVWKNGMALSSSNNFDLGDITQWMRMTVSTMAPAVVRPYYVGATEAYKPKLQITEIIGFDRVLTTTERQEVEDYLVNKYNEGPTVSLTAPTQSASYNAGNTVALTATATDQNGSVSKVEFYQGCVYLGEDTSSPYSYDWTNVASGCYTLTAKAYDSFGAVTTSSPITINVLRLTGRQLWLKADTGITKDANGYVSNWADQSGQGHHAAQSTQASKPLFISSAVNNMPALSFDADSLTVSGTFQVAQLYAMFKSPTATFHAYGPILGVPSAYVSTRTFLFTGGGSNFQSSCLPGAVWKNVTAMSSSNYYDLGDVSKWMQFGATVANPTATRSYLVGASEANTNKLQIAEILAYDTVLPEPERRAVEFYLAFRYNEPPTVSLTAPANNTCADAGSAITLTAAATDPNGTVSKVEFYQGTTKLGEATSSPYSFTWSNVTTGCYTISAQAYDNNGAVTTSAPVNVFVIRTGGRQLWLKADAGVTKDGSNYVSDWSDQTALGHHAAQSTQASKPLFVSSAVNGCPALSFDSDFMTVNGVFQAAQFFTVCKSPTSTFYGYAPMLGVTSAYIASRTCMTNGGYSNFTSGPPPAAVWKNGTALSAGNNYDLGDLTQWMQVSITTSASTTPRAYQVCATEAFTNKLYIAELIAYDTVLSDAERQVVENYLRARYALP